LNSNSRRRALIFYVLAALAVVAAVLYVRTVTKKPPVSPRTVVARLGDMIVKVSETGTIEPVDKVDVKSKVAGRLLSIPIEEGEHVVKGQLIALVDRSLIDPQIASTRAQLASDEAHYEQTIAQYILSEKQDQMAIEQSEAAVVSAKTHLDVVSAGARSQQIAEDQQAVDRAKITLDDSLRSQQRKAKLLQSGYIAQSDYDTAQVAVDTATSNLQSAQQALSLDEAGPRAQDVADAAAGVNTAQVNLASARINAEENLVKKFDIDQARATVQQTTNNLDQLLVNLDDTTIVAPSSGIVLKKYKQENEIVQSATTGFSDSEAIVVTLGNRVCVDVDINEIDIAKVRPNAAVKITIDALPGEAFDGTVASIAPASTNAFDSTGASSSSSNDTISKFSVVIAFNQSDSRLRPGMTANVDIISADHPSVLLLPLEALNFDGNTGDVTVLTGDGKKVTKPIAIGLENDTDAEVVSGLSAGDRVIVPALSQQRRTINLNGNGGDN
jgi:HlyD family secretion protein